MSVSISGEIVWAAPTPVVEVGTVNNSASIGTGKEPANDDWTVTIGNGTTPTKVTQNGNTVISLNDNANITIKNDAVVEGNSNSGGGGHFGSGPNVIEFNSNSTLSIEAGGTVQQLDTTNNGEAINAHGFGNTINNYGTIHSNNGAALWFQDVSTSNLEEDRNKVVNHGTISTSKGDGYNVFGSSRGGGDPDFKGTVNIVAPGILSAQTQGINNAANMTNNGKLIFEQPINDTYTGSAITGKCQVVKIGSGSLTMSSSGDNTYEGGTPEW